jgi:hypothetical protein
MILLNIGIRDLQHAFQLCIRRSASCWKDAMRTVHIRNGHGFSSWGSRTKAKNSNISYSNVELIDYGNRTSVNMSFSLFFLSCICKLVSFLTQAVSDYLSPVALVPSDTTLRISNSQRVAHQRVHLAVAFLAERRTMIFFLMIGRRQSNGSDSKPHDATWETMPLLPPFAQSLFVDYVFIFIFN